MGLVTNNLFQKLKPLSLGLLALFINFSAYANQAGGTNAGGNASLPNILGAIGGVIDSGLQFFDDVLGTFGQFFNDIGLGSFWNSFIGGIFGYYDCGQLQSGGLGQVFCNIVNSSSEIPALITGLAYLLGLVFTIAALFKLKDHVMDPRTPLSDSMKRFVAGGALFSLPMVTQVLQNTIMGTDNNMLNPYMYSGSSFMVSGNVGGLDASLLNFVVDLWEPMLIAIGAFGYLAGLVFTFIGISRLVKTAQEGAKGPTGAGTIMTFMTAGALFSLDGLMGAFSSSLFGTPVIAAYPMLSSFLDTGSDNVNLRIESVLSSIVAFVALVGWISFVRGFFILRDVAEGNNQASLMAASTHLIAGAVAVNLGPFLMAVQRTFGIEGLIFM